MTNINQSFLVQKHNNCSIRGRLKVYKNQRRINFIGKWRNGLRSCCTYQNREFDSSLRFSFI